MKKQTARRISTLVVAFCLILAMMPTASFAGRVKNQPTHVTTRSVKGKTGDVSRLTRKQAQPRLASSASAKTAIRRATLGTSGARVLTSRNLTRGKANDYYYTKMTSKQRKLYNSMLTLTKNPYSGDVVTISTGKNRGSDGYTDDDWFVAYQGLIYDHAELFWLWMDAGDSLFMKKPVRSGSSYKWLLWLDLKANIGVKYEKGEAPEPLFASEATYKNVMSNFNKAVNEFLSDIDQDHSDAVVAMKIHDKLVDEVTYQYDDTPFYDSSHTAFGALLTNKAVCDGYALAYSYLLKKCGIDSTVVLGYIGSPVTGGHAWNLVKLSGHWYEVDPTWDDLDSSSSSRDFLFITTREISTQMRYISSNSKHHRDATEPYSLLSRLLPTATATHFSPEYMEGYGTTVSDNRNAKGVKINLAALSSGRLYILGELPVLSDNTWNLAVATSSGSSWLKDSSVYKASGASTSSLYSLAEWNAGSGVLPLTFNTASASSGSSVSASDRRVTLNVEYDNGATGNVTATLKFAAKAKASSRRYTGKILTPVITVTGAGGATLQDSLYSQTLYAGAVNPGLYANLVTVSGNALYDKGTIVAWMKIVPANASVSKVSRKSGKLIASWNASTLTRSSATGYQVQVSRSRSFGSGTKTFTVSGSSKKSLKTAYLASKKASAYVRVRTYAKAQYHGISGNALSMAKDGKPVKVYSSWSKAKLLKKGA